MENILVVENNKVFLKLFSHYLDGKGYKVFTAEDGLAALEILESMGDQGPRVIFTDLVMPRINGEKFCRIVRRMPELQGIPLVIVSAIAAEGGVDFVSFGADVCIAKVQALSGLLPICASCKKIRDDGGYWNQIEVYIRRHSEAEFSHSLCPDCAQRLYPKIFKEKPEA